MELCFKFLWEPCAMFFFYFEQVKNGPRVILWLVKENKMKQMNLWMIVSLPFIMINRGSYMRAHVLLNSLNKLGKRDKM